MPYLVHSCENYMPNKSKCSFRLLRNRVSAQQARERKKRYIHDLERQLEDKESELSAVKAKMQDVTSDNMTLRRLITTMRGANTLPAHPANSSCMPGQASPNRTRRVSNTYGENVQDQQAHKWHVSEVCSPFHDQFLRLLYGCCPCCNHLCPRV